MTRLRLDPARILLDTLGHPPQRCRSLSPCDGRGTPPCAFTLVEILIVVVLVAILAAVVVPASSNSSISQLQGAAILIAGDIQYVQAEAINTGQVLRIDFVGGNQYQAIDPDGGPGGRAVVLPYPQKDYPAHNNQFIVDLDDPGPLQGVQLTSALFGGQPRLEFGVYGEPVASGEIVLRAGIYQVRITVQSVTGLISIGPLEKA